MIKKLFFIFLLINIWIPKGKTQMGTIPFESDGIISWIIKGEIIEFNIQLNYKSWVGIGWHSIYDHTDGMQNVDFTIAEFEENGKVIVDDYYSNMNEKGGFSKPKKDTSFPKPGYNNILYFHGKQFQETTTVTFIRPLKTNDTYDNPMVPGKVNLIWAHGKSGVNNISYHYHHRGHILVDFFSGKSDNLEESLPIWHGSLMIFSFGICMSFGIIIAKFLKNYYWWFPLHIIFQIVGLLTAISAFIIAFKMNHGKHFDTLHSWFGLSTLSLAAISPILGTIAHFLYNPSRTEIPIWPDIVHWWFGRLTVILSFVTIILGMRLYGTPMVFE